METKIHKVKLFYINTGMPVKAEDFHLIITKNKKHETILRFKKHDKEHLKEHEYVYKKILHKKPDSLQLVVDDDQDLIVHFEDNEGCDQAFNALESHKSVNMSN